MCETLNTPYMTRRRIIENLKEMVFGAKAFQNLGFQLLILLRAFYFAKKQ